jgi:hypothetical protein
VPLGLDGMMQKKTVDCSDEWQKENLAVRTKLSL